MDPGLSLGLFNAGGTYLLAQNTRPDTNAFTVSVYLALINLGGAFSPFVVNFCGKIPGGGVDIKFLFAGVVSVILVIYSLILNIKKN
ncbi:MAG: hypothetical protein K5883_01945 [Pseudobutyrivibrio sp.]|nr:hypothetical protein [Pseudobutyrivibrio sp.]